MWRAVEPVHALLRILRTSVQKKGQLMGQTEETLGLKALPRGQWHCPPGIAAMPSEGNAKGNFNRRRRVIRIYLRRTRGSSRILVFCELVTIRILYTI